MHEYSIETLKPRRSRNLAPRRSVWRSKGKRPKSRRKALPRAKLMPIRKADKLFSKTVKERDKKCLHPDSNHHGSNTCSHYFTRAKKSVRFDPDNCITLCWWHHFKSKDLGWEYQKQTVEKHGWDGQYTLFMKKWLGEERFEALKERAAMKMSQTEAIKTFAAKLNLSTENVN